MPDIGRGYDRHVARLREQCTLRSQNRVAIQRLLSSAVGRPALRAVAHCSAALSIVAVVMGA